MIGYPISDNQRGELVISMKKIILVLIVIVILAALPFLIKSKPSAITVFHAGSLTVPLQKIISMYPDKAVEIRLEGSGSVEAVRKITELGKRADILASADYRLIPKMMYPKYADWYVIFATNEIVLTYTNKSKYASEINEKNWPDIIMKGDVKLGFSDPNKDPCGYRSVITLLLSSKYYNKPLDQLLMNETNIKVKGMEAWVPDPIEIKGKGIVIRPKSVELLSLLEAGVLDYAFEYKSVAVQHRLKYMQLPPEINMGSPALAKVYSKVKVHIFSGSEKEKVLTGAPIAYGLTVTKVAENREQALKFIRFLLTKGLDVFKETGQPPVRPPLAYGNIPSEIKDVVKVNP